MAIHHARPGELIDLARWPRDVEAGKSHTLIVADGLTVARLVLEKDREIPEHRIAAPITIHCVSGKIELVTTRAQQMLTSGQLVYLPADDPHTLRAYADAVILLTIAETRTGNPPE
ncbi:MAG: hypothetical protein ACFHX7_23565 [Pseudomonadota bacterium]